MEMSCTLTANIHIESVRPHKKGVLFLTKTAQAGIIADTVELVLFIFQNVVH